MITENTTLEDLASIVSDALERAGIVATLSGGAAVSIYTENRYVSEDLDFVTVALVNELKMALEPIGFSPTGRPRLSVFEHPNTRWYIEFPPAPLSFGGTYIDPSECAQIEVGLGKLRIITPTQSVMDRLIAATAWKEQQSLEQALLVAEHQHKNIDWAELDLWVSNEGITSNREIVEFYRLIGRPLLGT
ncbi:hypothetical protein ACFL17_05250 [Pseudomonadota bacterium]